MKSFKRLSRQRVSIDQVSRIEDIMRTDTSLVRLFYPVFHHEGLGPVHKNRDLYDLKFSERLDDQQCSAVPVRICFKVITKGPKTHII